MELVANPEYEHEIIAVSLSKVSDAPYYGERFISLMLGQQVEGVDVFKFGELSPKFITVKKNGENYDCSNILRSDERQIANTIQQLQVENNRKRFNGAV